MNSSVVSIIIPVKQINNYLIKENFPHIDKLSSNDFEVVLLPNDRSAKDKFLLKKYHWLRIVPTVNISRPALKRDIGVKKAKGDIVAFIDDDAYPASDWLTNAIKIFKKENVAAVCGPGILPQRSSFWEKVFDEILKSWIGSGRYTYRFIKQKQRYVDDYPSVNFFIRKKIFIKLGGFDNDYWPGEDSKLCEDIVYKEYKKILYSPDVVVYHHRRNDLAGYLKQHANYGFHRGAFFAHGDRNSRRFSYLIPTSFVLYLFFLFLYLLFSIFHLQYLIPNIPYPISLIPIILYLFFGIALIITAFKNTDDLVIAFITFPVLFITHVVYGTMFVKGFIKGIIQKENIYK